MANDFLLAKWKMWFSLFDFNKDGKICSEDLESSRYKFANLHHLDAGRKKVTMDKYSAWWSEYIMWGKSEITEAEFVECQRKAFETDKEQFVRRMRENQELICNLMDTDGDGIITEDDTYIMCKSNEHNGDAEDRRVFEAHNPVDGKIPVKTMVEVWTHFLIFEDRTKADAIVELFKAGL